MFAVVLMLVFAGTALLFVGAYAFANRRRLAAAAALRERIESGLEPAPAVVLRDERKSTVPLLDRLLTARSMTPVLERFVHQSGTRLTVGEFVLASALFGAAGFVLLQSFGLALALPAAAIGLLLPSAAVLLLRRRRLRKFEEQLPDAIDMIVNAMRAGFSFQSAIRFVGDEMPKPLGEEFMRVYDEQRLGIDVRTALLGLQHRVDSIDVRMFVTSLLIQRETGGSLGEVLGGLANIIRAREALRGQIETLTAEPKFTGRALSVLPVVAFVLIWFLNRPMLEPMIETSAGRAMLWYGAASVVVGALVLRRMARIEA